MVKISTDSFFHVYSFLAKFLIRGSEKEIPLSIAAMTGRGLEIWRGIRPNRQLIKEIGEASSVTITLVSKTKRFKREISMNIADPDYLPFGVGVDLGGQRVGRVDAVLDEIALEGVIFRTLSSVKVVDTEGDSDREGTE